MEPNRQLMQKHLLNILKRLRDFILWAVPATWRWLRGTVFPLLQRLYLRLPYRRVVAPAAAFVVVLLGLALLPSSDDDAPRVAGTPSPIQVPPREARWVEQLLSGDWEAQKDATRDVLQAVGAKLIDDDVLIPDGEGLFVTSPELVMLAMDGARKASVSRLTLAELAFMLQDFGFPFPEDQIPSVILENGVREWTRAALDDPGLSGASSARFLHAMAAQQTPAIDLTSPDWTAEQHRLTHLELFAFFAAFADGSPGVAQQVASGWALPLPDSRVVTASLGRVLGTAMPAAYAADGPSTACSPLADYYDAIGKKLDFEQNNKTMEGALGAIGNAVDAAGSVGKAVAKALEAINNAFKVQKLVLLYSSLDMRLVADQDFVHKPHPGETDKEVVFNVTVGLDEDKYREFQQKLNSSESGKALKECLASLGLPAPSDMTDILSEMKDWDVEWRLAGGNSMWSMFSSGHASWSREKNGFEGPGHSREKLSPVDDTRVGADFIVDVERETREDGDILSANVTGHAILRTDTTVPGTDVAKSLESAWKTLMDGELMGGAAMVGTVLGATGSAAVEAATGWARRIWDPEAFSNITVAYHQEVIPDYIYEGTVTAVFNYNNTYRERGRSRDSGDYSNYDQSEQGRGRLTAKVRTDRMVPYMRNEGTDVWYMSGDATVSGSYNFRSTRDALDSCAGVMLQQRKEMRNERGGGGNSESGAYSIRLEQSGDRMRGGDYRLNLIFNGAGISIPYTHSYNDTGQAGCEFSARDGWDRSGSEEKIASVSTTNGGLSHVVELDGLYPETISGQHTVAPEPSRYSTGPTSSSREHSTTWTWNLRRVDPTP